MGTQKSFPVFEADQVLTNNHLNDLRRYLEEEERLTRMKLIGSGIVCGLEITSTASSIKVSKGCGLTSQGYLITHCESEYTHVIPYSGFEFPSDINFIFQCGSTEKTGVPFYKPDFADSILQLIKATDLEKLSPEVKATAVELKGFSTEKLNQFAVVIFLEAEQINLKNCDTNDCNDKGSRMDFEPKLLLVPKAHLDKIKRTGNQVPNNPLPQIELKRYNVPVKNLLSTQTVLSAFATITDDSTIDGIAVALNASFTNYSHLLKEEANNPFTTIADKLKAIRKKITDTNPLFIQYFYDLLDDILKAYHEFREKAYYINSVCCLDENLFPLHLALGEATVNTAQGKQSHYREYFIYAPLFDSQSKGLSELRFLFKRLKILESNFVIESPSAFLKRITKITPSNFGRSYLSDRAIPYYYNVTGGAASSALYRHWSYRKTSRGEAETNLSYKSDEYAHAANMLVREPFLFDIERYNFFRVEGHIGKPIATALTEVLKIKQEKNLPVEVIALSADFIGAILKGEEPECILQDLEADYRLIIAEFMCKLHDAFCSIYKFDFAPRPREVVRGAIATEFIARTVSGATAGEAAATVTAIDDDDDEVNTLMSKTDFATINAFHPAMSQLVAETHLTKKYVKGSSLLKICGVKDKSVGFTYLSNIVGNEFKMPVDLTSNIKAASLYNRFFELIDNIENMFSILLTNELGELNMNQFKTAYNRYETSVKNLSRQLKTITDKVQIFLTTCIVEKLEALKAEYKRRIDQYNLARKFNNYFKAHGGIEHKAGVTRGGTFILVYHEFTKGRKFDAGALLQHKKLGALMLTRFPDLLQADAGDEKIKIATEELEKAVDLDCPENFTFFNNAISDYVKADTSISEASKTALLAAFRQQKPKPGFNFANGTVIADFYVPYICCSDCSPVSYVLIEQQEQPSIEKIVFDIKPGTFLFDDAHNYPFTAVPAVTDAKKEQNPFTSPDLSNPGKLNLWADEENTLFLHPAMELEKTLKTTVKYKDVSVDITIIKPDASFTATVTRDASGGNLLLQVEATSKDAKEYKWLVNGNPAILPDNAALPKKIIIGPNDTTAQFAIELIITYNINDAISDDSKKRTFKISIIRNNANGGPF